MINFLQAIANVKINDRDDIFAAVQWLMCEATSADGYSNYDKRAEWGDVIQALAAVQVEERASIVVVTKRLTAGIKKYDMLHQCHAIIRALTAVQAKARVGVVAAIEQAITQEMTANQQLTIVHLFSKCKDPNYLLTAVNRVFTQTVAADLRFAVICFLADIPNKYMEDAILAAICILDSGTVDTIYLVAHIESLHRIPAAQYGWMVEVLLEIEDSRARSIIFDKLRSNLGYLRDYQRNWARDQKILMAVTQLHAPEMIAPVLQCLGQCITQKLQTQWAYSVPLRLEGRKQFGIGMLPK